jgi:NAD(P)-dependent dehydrogenase (short-subunit alcohol dehydrogenase family)
VLDVGGKGKFIQGDSSKWTDVDRVVTEAVKEYGRLDVFVNNAAIGVGGSLLETSEQDWDKVLSVNAKGYFFGCKRAVQQMLTQEPRNELRGRIINISSQHGMVCCPGDLAYGVGKAAAVYMTRQIAVDYAKEHIAVNAVAPGKIVTGCDSDNREYSLMRTPAPRLGRPEDIANAVVFLASEQATAFITGINMMVDGGFTCY